MFNDSYIAYLLIYIALYFIPDSWNFASYIYMYPYFVVMYLANIKRKRWALFGSRRTWIALASLYVVMMLFYDRNIYIYESHYCLYGGVKLPLVQLYNDTFRMLVGFLGAYVVFGVVSQFSSCNAVRKIANIGRNSLGIYIISGSFFDIVRRKNFLLQIGITHHVLLIVLWTFLLTLLSFILTLAIKQIPYVKTILLGIPTRKDIDHE